MILEVWREATFTFFLLILRHTLWQGLECRTVICSVQLGVGRKGRGSVCATQFPFCHWWSLNISSCRLPPVLLHKCWANSTALLKDYWYFKVCLHSYTTYSICRFLLDESLKDQVFSARISVWCLSSVDRLHSIILAERESERTLIMCDIDRLKAPGGRAHKQSSNWRISSFKSASEFILI